MHTVKKTESKTLNIKDIRTENGQIINENGVILNLAYLFENAFGDVENNEVQDE